MQKQNRGFRKDFVRFTAVIAAIYMVAFSSPVFSAKSVADDDSNCRLDVMLNNIKQKKKHANPEWEQEKKCGDPEKLQLYERFDLDGAIYSKDKLIWDFVNIAFSDALPLENSIEPFRAIQPMKEKLFPSGLNKGTWLSQYSERSKGLPRVGVINKWNGDITVGIGPPLYPRFGRVGLDPKYDPSREAAYDHIRQRLELILPQLQEVTGLPIRFVDSHAPQEKTENFARVRILHTQRSSMNNNYKLFSIDPHSTDQFPLSTLVVGLVEFTPFARAQVDGSFIPEANNSIGFSTCNILETLPATSFDTLLSECIVRTLGLPEMSKLNDKALVGHWNAEADSVSKTSYFDGEAAFKRSDDNKDPIKVAETDFLRQIEEKPLTQYDKAMVSLLYCPAIKTGMDKMAVIKTLWQHSECFKKLRSQDSIKKGEEIHA